MDSSVTLMWLPHSYTILTIKDGVIYLMAFLPDLPHFEVEALSVADNLQLTLRARST